MNNNKVFLTKWYKEYVKGKRRSCYYEIINYCVIVYDIPVCFVTLQASFNSNQMKQIDSQLNRIAYWTYIVQL